MFIGLGPASRCRRPAITLIECIMALTILPLAVTGVAYAVMAGHQSAAEALRNERAATLGEALLEEILSKPYADPQGATSAGPDAGENSRSAYDNMDDYHGFSDTAGNVQNASGVKYATEFQTLRRTVSCSYSTQTLFGKTFNVLQIVVTVTDRRGTALTLRRTVSEPDE